MEIQKKDIRSLTKEQLRDFFVANGDKAFRGNQVYEWLWSKAIHSFEDMTNVSKETRTMLESNFVINHIKVDTMQRSEDGTVKNAVRLHDGLIVESVLIPTDTRTTACVSSQVGCSLDCNFCATARLKRMRNLEPAEIYDQVIAIDKESRLYYNHPLSNIVFMGMGEPLLNYDHLIKGINRITSPDGLNMSPSRITVSTVGLTKMIKKLADDEVKFNLAISLHTANNKKRNEIIPVNQQNSLEDLADALKYYYQKTKNRVTFEYLLLSKFNDSVADARELAEFCKIVPCKINLIEYNHVEGTGFRKSPEININGFAGILETKNLIVNIRKSRGEDIAAACGQLANKIQQS